MFSAILKFTDATTTLYSANHKLDKTDLNIFTSLACHAMLNSHSCKNIEYMYK